MIGLLLAGALGALLVVERRHLREFPRRALLQRWVTWAVIAPTYVLAVLAGPATTALLAAALSLQALREYAVLTSLPAAYRRVLLTLGVVAAPAALVSSDLFFVLPPALLLLATLQPLLLSRVPHGMRHLAFSAFGWAYLAWLPAFLLLLHRSNDRGPGLLLTVGLAVALSDIGAFVIGSRFGRHRLAPSLSPNKTWEGVAGNLLGSLLGVGIMGHVVQLGITLPVAVGLGALVAVGAVWGDLVESAIKREFGVKDAGHWLPGFGGLLDRVDSLVVVVPLVYYAARLLGPGF
jgi:phosphatidate cytidylyltransferase